MNWIIEDFGDETYSNFLYEIKDKNSVKLLTLKDFYTSSTTDFYEKFYPENSKVLFLGSCNICREFKRKNVYNPLIWLTEELYDCRHYYPIFNDLLLNYDHQFISYRGLKIQSKVIWQEFGDENGFMFIKPCSGMKSFTGDVETIEEFLKNVEWRDNFVKEQDKVLVSKPTNILGEWRFIVSESEIVACSQYRKKGSIFKQEGAPDKAFEIVYKGLQLWNDFNVKNNIEPDKIWCIDICELSEDQYKIIEIGAFNCAGLYKCNTNSIIKKCEELIEKES